jgi:DNA-binding transcriptional ArsR family regulator
MAQERLTVRALGIVLAVFALAALPGALAVQPVTVDPPPVTAHVEGQSASVDSSEYVDDAPAVTGGVETQDVDVNVHGPTCTVDPSQKITKGKVTTCSDADVAAPDADDVNGFIDAELDLRLAEAAAPVDDAPPAAPLVVEAVEYAAAHPTALLAAAAAGASLLGLYAAWRALKWTGLFALLPLYSHIRDDEILDDANRAGIYRLIQTEPGISTKDIAERLGLAWGTVTHHLGKLEKRRFVVSKKYGKYRRYFANGEGGTEQKDQVAVLRLDRTGDIAALIRSNPGLTQKAVSGLLGVSSSTILWHVKRLEGAQLITKVRDGKLVRYYPAAGLDATMAPSPPGPMANAA